MRGNNTRREIVERDLCHVYEERKERERETYEDREGPG
jgi:hypothetical protein